MVRSVFPHANIRSEDADGAAFYSPNHRPDIVVLDFEGGGRHLLIDVSVARPLALSHVAGASLTAGYTADRARSGPSSWPTATSGTIVWCPLSWRSLGPWGP
eukprot:jgi/Mesvir1/26506/Mv16164-RA.1